MTTSVLEIPDLVAFRARSHQSEMQVNLIHFAKVVGYQNRIPELLISCTHASEMVNGNPVLTYEFFAPRLGETVQDQNLRLVPLLRLNNAVSIRHKGSHETLGTTMEEFQRQIAEDGRPQITPLFTIQKRETRTDEPHTVQIEVWAGLSPNLY